MRPLALALALLADRAAAQTAPPQLTLEWSALAERIVGQLALQPGEKVLLLAHPGQFEELVPHLRYQVMKAGGADLGCLDVLAAPVPAVWDLGLVQNANRPTREALRTILRDVDAAVMLPGTGPRDPAYSALQDLLLSAGGSRRTIHFHWGGGGAPSALAVPGHPLPAPHAIDSTYQRAVLRTDYAALGAAQGAFEAALRTGEVRVTTALGTDLRFRIGDRPVNLQDGDASAARARRARVLIDREIELPAGAIRVAPAEETVEGVVAFPPSSWDGRPVAGLRLRFTRGRVASVEAAAGRAAVEAEMDAAGEAGRAFREFALGFNPELAVPERGPWIPYYGYGAGVVRLSLGDNRELGGAVGGGYVRWNLFTDATVKVGERVFIRDGRPVGP